jgi:hypothetical protein
MINIKELTEITLPDPKNFLTVRETLSRIGIASKKDNTLYQSCHILHKQGRYYIVHFKQMFLLDGKKSDFSEEDRGRLNTIVNLLEEWGLVDIVDEPPKDQARAPLSQIKILSYKDKGNWKLVTKYNIGKRSKDIKND